MLEAIEEAIAARIDAGTSGILDSWASAGRTVAESSTCSLSEGEKAVLVRRLEDNISQLENELHRVLTE
jgi:hypothetical protein